MLSVQGSRERGPFDATDRLWVEKLLPHLGRAVQMRAQLDGLQRRLGLLEDLIEGLIVGVVILDDRGAVVHANTAARRIERLRDGLTITGRRLRAASRADDAALARAIADAIATTHRTGLGGGGALAVTRPSGRRPWSLLVCAGPGADSHSPFRTACALVLIGDPDSRMESEPERVGRLYGLTAAQSRLACAIGSGESLEMYAERNGIAESTARWTLKQVLAKTGAARQADLVRMLLTGPAAFAKGVPDRSER
jgi:DNA-binding CsgD family transcriptional regulator